MFTIEQIENLAEEKQKKLLKLIEQKGEEYDVYPLTAEQRRMWFLYKINTKNTHYNAICEIELKGKVVFDELEMAMRKIIDRHSILRTIFISINGIPFQVVNQEFNYKMEYIDLSQINDLERDKKYFELIKKETNISFDLTKEIPIKTILVYLGSNKYIMLLKMHHICFDGWSLGIFIKDFINIYKDIILKKEIKMPNIKYKYSDYALWQKEQQSNNCYEKQLNYWYDKLKNTKESINFNYEKALDNNENLSYNGAALETKLTKQEFETLQSIATINKTSIYAVALTLFYIVLSRNTQQHNINIGTPVANRQKQEYEDILGFFANTLVINADIDENIYLFELLSQVKNTIVDAMENQDIPFDLVVDKLNIKRSSNMSPLFQIMFSLRNETLVNGNITSVQNLPGVDVRFKTLDSENVEYVQFKMIFTITQLSDHMLISLGYNKDLLDKKYMYSFIEQYHYIIEQLSTNNNPIINELQAITTKDKDSLAKLISNKDIIKYEPDSIFDKITDYLDITVCAKANKGHVTVLNASNEVTPIGIIGSIYYKPFGELNWYNTGDRGYWSCNGDLEITYKKYSGFVVDNIYTSLKPIQQDILKNTGVSDCKILAYEHENEVSLIVYYSGNVDVTNEELLAFIPVQYRQKIKLISYKVNFMPVDQYGNYNISLLEKEIYHKLREVEDIKDNLQSIQNVKQAVIYGEAYKSNNEKILLEDLYTINSLKKENNFSKEDNKAVLKGEIIDELSFKTLSELLQIRANSCGKKLIRTIQYNRPESSFTYQELYESACKIAQGLYDRGTRQGDKVIIITKELDLFIKSLWGCFVLGAVPVPLGVARLINSQGDAAVDKFVKVFEKLNQPKVITSNDETSALIEISNKYSFVINSLYRIEDLLKSKSISNLAQINEKDTAIILFTSGSTGIPKGVQLTHRNILKRSQATTIYNNQNENDISLNWMPLDHVGGVVMFHIRDVYGGIEQIQVETAEILKAPLLWMDYINKYRVTLTWAPTFAYGLVVQRKKDIDSYHWDLSCLRFILNGGEMINEHTSLEFLKALKGKGLSSNSMYPSWGMSETSSGVLFSKNFGYSNWDGYVEVGQPIPGVEIKVVDEDNNIVQQGEVGSLLVRGETITKGYYDNIEQNKKSFTSDGWFITGDLAIIKNSQVILTGRNNNLIIINGVNYNAIEIENSIAEITTELDYIIACGVRAKEGGNEQLAIFYINKEGINEKEIRKKIQVGVYSKFGLGVDYIICLEDDEVPRGALEKIQRKKIKQNFENGVYDKRVDKVTNNITNWFYQEKWINYNNGTTLDTVPVGVYLIFCDSYGLGKLVGKRLEEAGSKCIYVSIGNINAIDNNKATIKIEDTEAYKWLFDELKSQEISINSIIHMYGYYDNQDNDFEETQQKGVYSLKEVFKNASFIANSNQNIRLYVVTNYIAITSEDDIIIPDKATMTGFLRSAQLEIYNMDIVHIDFDKIDITYHTECLINELKTIKNRNDIAYRGKARLSPIFRNMEITKSDNKQEFIKYRGLYIILGGLGGIGVFLCRHLLERYDAELIIIGKSDLKLNKEKEEVFNKLRSKGKVHYTAIDAGISTVFSNTVKKYEKELNRSIDGIFNLAGSENIKKHYAELKKHLIVNETKEYYNSMFESKVFVTKAIFDFVKERECVNVINFASCNGVIGGNSFSGYSAANSYVNAITHMNRKRNKENYICINWSMWDGIGMCEDIEVDYMNVSIAMGYQMISAKNGISSLECLLQRKKNNVLVGIDGANSNMNIRYNSDDYKGQYNWEIYYSTFDKRKLSTKDLVKIIKDDGININYLKELPLTIDGSINCSGLRNAFENENIVTSKFLTETEIELIEIWKEILGHGNFSIEDKFFEIGGNSIKSIQVVSAINQKFHVQIEIVDLFKYTSVEELAKYISSMDTKDTQKNKNLESGIVGMTF